MVSVVYLHGFRSSPSSPKVNFFREKAEKEGIQFYAPDLNAPDFENLTLTAMIAEFVRTLQQCDNDTIVFSSSLGTLPLLQAIDKKLPGTDKIKKTILLSPTFNFRKITTALEEGEDYFHTWEKDDYKEFQHFAYQHKAKLKYDFVRDMDNYDTESIRLSRPVIVFHGEQDEIVPVKDVEEFLSRQENIRFYRIEGGDHVLLAHLDFIWEKSREFILA